MGNKELNKYCCFKPSKSGNGVTITNDVGNAIAILLHSKQWIGCIAYDDAKNRIIWTASPPELDGFYKPREMELFSEAHVPYIQHWFLQRLNVSFNRETILHAVEYVSHVNRINTLQAMIIKSLAKAQINEHNAISYLKKWPSLILNCDDTTENNLIGEKWIIAAVKRAFIPGVKFDCVLILEGKQGKKKSTVLEVLAGGPDFFQDSVTDIKNKDTVQLISGNWIIELQELQAFKKSEIEFTKSFISRRIDKIRLPYARYVSEVPRQCVFAGTTNDTEYLRDPTGARRFWPIKIGDRIDIELLEKIRDDVIGAAFILFKSGERHYIEDSDVDLDPIQESRRETDPWEEMIEDYCFGDGMRKIIDVNKVAQECIIIDKKDINRNVQMRISSALRRLGYERRRIPVDGKRVWRYVK